NKVNYWHTVKQPPSERSHDELSHAADQVPSEGGRRFENKSGEAWGRLRAVPEASDGVLVLLVGCDGWTFEPARYEVLHDRVFRIAPEITPPHGLGMYQPGRRDKRRSHGNLGEPARRMRRTEATVEEDDHGGRRNDRD